MVTDDREGLRIAVIYGGRSAEREISLGSGEEVAQALQGRGHRVTLLDPTLVDLQTAPLDEYDVAFNALHGSFGEDGQLQELLDRRGLRYTGSGQHASRLAFKKSLAKQTFEEAGVATPRAILGHESNTETELCVAAESIGFPLVIKPDEQGSSLGVSVVSCIEEVIEAFRVAFQFGPVALCEGFVAGTEWTVPIVDDDLLPIIQIETAVSYFDFASKYRSDDTRYRFDSSLSDDVIQEIAETGRQACRALGTRGIARVDIRLDHNLSPWVLEVNTSPGMTDHSLVPKAALQVGLSLGELCELTIRRTLGEVVRIPSVEEGTV
ncbi:MAG: D-alanine--D-alanine ligase [Planctomycetaceae bacterium]